jgi:3alpha(or 20beta)-hydroxysteroid dehydrogenase
VTADPFRLDGKVAIVTGAARGLGRAIADTLVDAGARVMFTDVLDIGTVPQGNAATFHDVSEEAHWADIVARTFAQFGGLDILVNNAGIFHAAQLTETDVNDFDRVMRINVRGVFLGMKQCALAMRPGGIAGKGGAIVNLSSVAGLTGSNLVVAYGASKGAVRLMTKDAAIEFQTLGYGIRVNSIHPGVIQTQMGDAVLAGFAPLTGSVAASQGLIETMTPMKRLGSSPEIANVVRFLVSDAASYMTGAEVAVDGGMTAQ